MITPVRKCPPNVLQSVARFVCQDREFMDKLVKEGEGVTRLTVWSIEINDVMKRLLAKMGFAPDRKVVEMTSKI